MTRAVHLPSRPFRHFPMLSLPLACAALAACTGLEPSVVSVSGRAVEIVEAGEGPSTVVFESGLGNDWTPWAAVMNELGAQARTFAYSRPGYGQSEPATGPRDAAHIVEELRALLAARSWAPPYVLVGHSLGGAYMELFAKAHPEEVTGVVLVDPRHRDFSAACELAGYAGCAPPAELVASLPQVQIDELQQFARTSDEIQAVGAFGPYPVRVLTATAHGFSPQVEALWESMLGSLAAEAADGAQQLFIGAGHELQLEQPQAVAQVILSLLPETQAAQRSEGSSWWAR